MRTLLTILLLAATGFSAPNYRLVWSDEFNATGLPNPENWSYDFGGGGWGNNELQFYKAANPKNTWVEDGNLKITVLREDTIYSDWRGNTKVNHLSSARIYTANKHDWLYGRFEARMKLPKGAGMWPAFWMVPAASVYGGWPSGGEIDILENYGFEPWLMHGSVHTKNNYGENNRNGYAVVGNPNDSFHVYSMDWRQDTISIFVDGIEYFRYVNPKTSYADWPFDRPFPLILNVAVYGPWETISQEAYPEPQSLVVDYVRVYQLSDVPNDSVTLSMEQTAGGTISINSPATKFPSGTSVQIQAVPNIGYKFDGWTQGAVGKLAADNLTLDANLTLAAAFTKLPDSVALTLTQTTGGTISVRPAANKYLSGSSVQITALAENGYQFTGWAQGAAEGKLAIDNLTLTSTETLSATFTKITEIARLSLRQTIGGKISVSPDKDSYQPGEKVQIKAVAEKDYVFAGWSTGTASMLATDSVLVESLSTLSALFASAGELIVNGGFELGLQGWSFWNDASLPSTYALKDGGICLRPGGVGAFGWYSQMTYSGFNVVPNHDYLVSFVAKAKVKRSFTIFLSQASDPWDSLTKHSVVTVDTAFARHDFMLSTMDKSGAGRVEVNFANDTSELCLDSISVKLRPGTASYRYGTGGKGFNVALSNGSLQFKSEQPGSWLLRRQDGATVGRGNIPSSGTQTVRLGAKGLLLLQVHSADGTVSEQTVPNL